LNVPEEFEPRGQLFFLKNIETVFDVGFSVNDKKLRVLCADDGGRPWGAADHPDILGVKSKPGFVREYIHIAKT